MIMKSNLTNDEKLQCIEFKKIQEVAGKWRNEQTYSRDDTERIPTMFSIKIADVRVSIIREHVHYPDKWIMSCDAIAGSRHVVLKAKNPVDAAKEALSICHDTCLNRYNAFNAELYSKLKPS